MKNKPFTIYQFIVHVGSLIPFGILIWDFYHQNLTINPIQEATLRTGKIALILLILSLACSPANAIFGFRQALKIRRPLGLYTFFYVSIHLLIFIGVDYGFKWIFIWGAIVEKRYALAGLSAYLILLPMAITSTKWWKKKLGKNWKRLHNYVYLVGTLVIVHYIWLVKVNYGKPIYYGLIMLTLLILRMPKVRKKLSRGRSKIRITI